jgi:hypothetical protein
MQHLRPRVAAIAVQRRGAGWEALPRIADGQETYELVLSLVVVFGEEPAPGRWVVNAVSLSQ